MTDFFLNSPLGNTILVQGAAFVVLITTLKIKGENLEMRVGKLEDDRATKAEVEEIRKWIKDTHDDMKEMKREMMSAISVLNDDIKKILRGIKID